MNTHQLLLFAGAVVMARCTFAADEQSSDDFVGTRRSWEVGIQMSDYRYDGARRGRKDLGSQGGADRCLHAHQYEQLVRQIDGRVSYGSLEV